MTPAVGILRRAVRVYAWSLLVVALFGIAYPEPPDRAPGTLFVLADGLDPERDRTFGPPIPPIDQAAAPCLGCDDTRSTAPGTTEPPSAAPLHPGLHDLDASARRLTATAAGLA